MCYNIVASKFLATIFIYIGGLLWVTFLEFAPKGRQAKS